MLYSRIFKELDGILAALEAGETVTIEPGSVKANSIATAIGKTITGESLDQPFRHTEGPWRACLENPDADRSIHEPQWTIDAPSGQVATVLSENATADDILEGDARLLAASVSMYYLLLQVAEFWRNGTAVNAGAEVATEILDFLEGMAAQ